eukprot:scaffold63203_cov64-Phaeocystis_antarctica.AAC.6
MRRQRGLRTKAPHATRSEAPSRGCGRSSPSRSPSPPLAMSPSRWAAALPGTEGRWEGAAKPAARDEPRSRVMTRKALRNMQPAAATNIHLHIEPSGGTSRIAP